MSATSLALQAENFAILLNHGDTEGAVSQLADSYFTYDPGPDERSAADQIGALITDLFSAFPGATVRILEMKEDDANLHGIVSLNGTMTNSLWGAPPSGETVSWDVAFTVRQIDDKLAIRLDNVVMPELIGLLRAVNMVNPPDQMDQPPLYPVSAPDFVLQLTFNGKAALDPCAHLDEVKVTDTTIEVCDKCVASEDVWPALRMCLTCGHVGCCDTSKNKHAKAHYEESGHPLMRSIRLEEQWLWCYADNLFFPGYVLDKLRAGLE